MNDDTVVAAARVDGVQIEGAIKDFGEQVLVRVGSRLEDVEKAMILSTYRRYRSRGIKEVAKILGISYPTLRVRLNAYGV